jgi:hypothetical protein
VRTAADAVVLTFKGSSEWRPVDERVPLVWTKCHLGGARPWFRCIASVGDRPCGRPVAKLYLHKTPVFACRQCCGLAYASQREIPRHRAIRRAQKLRMQLAGSANLAEPLPERPRGMHRRTFYKLFNKAAEAQERSQALELKYLRRHYPEQSRGLTVVSPHARPRLPAGPSTRIAGSGRAFRPRGTPC